MTQNEGIAVKGGARKLATVSAFGNGGSGVFVLNPSPAATSSIRRLRIRGGYAPGSGGGIDVGASATVVVLDSEISHNRALSGSGGGIRSVGDLFVIRSTVTENAAAEGGGIAVEASGSAVIGSSAIFQNEGAQNGGGLSISGSGTLASSNSTVDFNSADKSGGALHSLGGTTTLVDVTMAGNQADPGGLNSGNGGGIRIDGGGVTLANTIVGDNRDYSPAAGTRHPDCSGTLSTLGYNLIESLAGCGFMFPVGTDITGKNPRLVPHVRLNGGPTATQVLKQSSPAINKGSPATTGLGSCNDEDQRGVPRPQGGRCDIGAYERARCGGVLVNQVGTAGRDHLSGEGSRDDGFLLLGGRDRANGRKGDDGICGGNGRDTLRGGDGNDLLIGGGGNDHCIGGPGRDRLRSC